MSTSQRNWNQFEAVILLEGYVDSLGGSVSREDVIKRVSQDLRKMAHNQGEKIDETFRNEAGILFQMQSMESAFCGHTVSKPATKLFSYIVEIYRKNNADYKSILETAKSMINGAEGLVEDKEISCKDKFKKHLSSLVSSDQLNEYFWCYDVIEKYCLEQEILKGSLFKTMNLDSLKKVKETIEHNPSFCFAHSVTYTKIKIAFYYYYTFVKEKSNINKWPATLKSNENDSIVRTKEDERLLDKYPIIYKRIFRTLRDSSLNGEGLTPDKICDLTQRIARISEIEDILNSVSWADFKEEKYWFSFYIVNHTIIDTERVNEETNVAEFVDDSHFESNYHQVEIIDFENADDLALTLPGYFNYFGDEHGPFSTWEELYRTFIGVLCDDYPYKFHSGMSFSSLDKHVDLEKYSATSMVAPVQIPGTDYILETNLYVTQMVAKMRYVLDLCCVNYENAKISYHKKDFSSSSSLQPTPVHPVEEKRTDIDKESIQVEFRNWLERSSDLAKRTIDSYVSAINRCELFAREHHYPDWHVYSLNVASVMKVMAVLKNDSEFIAKNASQHNQLRAALSKYKQFLEMGNMAEHEEITAAKSDGGFSSGQWRPKFSAQISHVLENHYPFGFRMDSAIEMMRFRNFAEQDQISIPDSDEELEKEILAIGMIIDRKVYLFENSFLDEMKEFVNNLLRDGKRVLFFDRFMEENAEWLEEHFVSSTEILKAILSKLFPDFYFAQNFFSYGGKKSEHKAIVMEIHRVIGEQRVIIYTDLCRQLPYIPSEKIAWSLSASDDFIWISEGKYFVMDHFVIEKGEASNILKFVEDECERKGYASMADLSYDNILEENYELTPSAIYDAVYNKVFKPKYKLNGKILTLESDVDANVLLGEYCRERESCSLSDVLDKSQELLGTKNRKLSFAALYDTKIRINKDLFISETQVQFDISQVDFILQEIIGDRFAPIKSVTTFAMFPSCGQSWNHYLLESFCYRFSKKYRLCVVNFNNRNVGIISAKSLNMSYTEMLCESAAKSDIELIPEAVGYYFFESGLMAKSSFSNLVEITEQASKLRERS